MISYRPSYGYNEKECPVSKKMRDFYFDVYEKHPLIAECIVEIFYLKGFYLIKVWPDSFVIEKYGDHQTIAILLLQELKERGHYDIQVAVANQIEYYEKQ
jgi:hypothetical protein